MIEDDFFSLFVSELIPVPCGDEKHHLTTGVRLGRSVVDHFKDFTDSVLFGPLSGDKYHWCTAFAPPKGA